MPLGLLALAVGAFGIGLTEFVIMGLLPEVATDFGVTEAAAGWLISGYALSVTVGALLLTAATTRLPRKPVLLGLLILFILGNVVSALAPGFGLMMLGRVLAALCHGAFFGIGAVVASSLVTKDKQSGAVAIMFTGLTAANVLGVPFGTFIGQQFGWRATFWIISAIGIVAFIGITTLVRLPARREAAPSLRHELTAFRSGQVWLSLTVTILAWGGLFGAFTYMAYTLTGAAGFPTAAVPWLLVVSGLGLFVGNWIGGRLADRSIDKTLIGFIAGLAVILAVFALVSGYQVPVIIALFLMGGLGFGTVPGLQTRVMNYASHAPTLASGANIGAFNLGNALGAWLGGVAISAGFGYVSPLWTGSAITVLALVVMLIAARLARSTAQGASRGSSQGTTPAQTSADKPSPAASR